MFGAFGRYCNGFFDYGRFNYGGIIMMILGVLLLAAVVYFIWKGNNSNKTESPLDVLRKRFANGEIGEEEYQKKKDMLQGK